MRFFFSAASPALMTRRRPGRVGGEGFLHEDVDALLDGVFELHGAEGRIAGEHGHVAGAQAVNGLAVGVEADEAAVGRHVHAVLELLAEDLQGAVQPVLEQVRHHGQFDRVHWANRRRQLRPRCRDRRSR